MGWTGNSTANWELGWEMGRVKRANTGSNPKNSSSVHTIKKFKFKNLELKHELI